MKISKLFHWLYAFLMLLPVFALGSKILYTSFNKNAYQSYYGENINDIQYTQISNNEYFEIGYNYLFNNTPYTITKTQEGSPVIFVENVYFNNTLVSDADNLYFTFDNNNQPVIIIRNNNNENIYRNNLSISAVQIRFTYLGMGNSRYVDISNYNYFYLISYNEYSYLDNVFYYSDNQLWNDNLFSWAKTSFLVSPISYIGGLFGLSSSSSIIYYLSYWLAISIIYLVFDLVMYVPLLVHRWIDKGIIE